MSLRITSDMRVIGLPSRSYMIRPELKLPKTNSKQYLVFLVKQCIAQKACVKRVVLYNVMIRFLLLLYYALSNLIHSSLCECFCFSTTYLKPHSYYAIIGQRISSFVQKQHKIVILIAHQNTSSFTS